VDESHLRVILGSIPRVSDPLGLREAQHFHF
jgi:hypothetical protein